MNLFGYRRRETGEVNVGGTPLGGSHPIRIQSMTDTPTMDTGACVAQTLRIAAAGGDYVRLTTRGIREAENLRRIRDGVRTAGCGVPLVADVHFNPDVADVAALHADKVRVNPGNYVDAARTFRRIEYTDEEYARELERIEARFVPFLRLCRENHTAIRIGVNHGSLSDRIMSRYGDTPQGIVESCMEFLRVCVREDFRDVVVSVKASNAAVMVRSVRLLVSTMEREGMRFPLHLGVTEAGDGEDGRIRSAVGIGALLADGIGDTVRVSLSEPPEAEIPVARKLVDYVLRLDGVSAMKADAAVDFDYLDPVRRKTRPVRDIGGDNVPVVVADAVDIAHGAGLRPDYVFCGRYLPPAEGRAGNYVIEADVWDGTPGTFPAFSRGTLSLAGRCAADLKFLFLACTDFDEEARACLEHHPEIVVVSLGDGDNRPAGHRALAHGLTRAGLRNPVVICQRYACEPERREDFLIESAADTGVLLFDGLCDGLYLYNNGVPGIDVADTAFGILQAARLRTTKTEYVSCPGCGRTLYDLRGTVARVKAATAHLKGLKIGIMGCIVNGPGEMADADYGYVGAAKGRVSLYKKKECVERNVPEEEAVERLLRLIRENGDDPDYPS